MFGNSKAVWNVSTVSVMVVGLLIAAGSAKADFVFGEPVSLGPAVNGPEGAFMPSLSADELELYFCTVRPGGYGDMDIWVTTRTSKDEAWGEPKNLGPMINASSWDGSPSLSGDGLALYFASYPRSGNLGPMGDIWVTRRAARNADWGAPENLGAPVNTAGDEAFVAISSDGLELYLSDWEPVQPGGYGGRDLWVSTRSTVSDPWGSPVRLNAPVNGPTHDEMHTLSSDGLVLLFSSWGRSGGYGARDIWMTRRTTTSIAWSTPVNLGPTINSPDFDQSGAISPDGSTLYFNSQRPGGYSDFDLWQAQVIPVVDFDGDGIVDAQDMCVMVDNWGTNYPLCDIAPLPFGNGQVDVQDLIVLAGYLRQKIEDPTLVAHWALDETEGMVVVDSLGNNDGYASGDPVWLPDGGYVDGALEFDGIDDFISAPAVFNPAGGPFSLLLWVKGGAPGQAIISEAGGSDWLSLDLLTGSLMTELTSRGRNASFLLSKATITDGNWHRIGLVWDGSQRTLYIDSVIVARDTQDGLDSTGLGLYIGCGDPKQPKTFFSGMIDDIRSYNRVVKP